MVGSSRSARQRVLLRRKERGEPPSQWPCFTQYLDMCAIVSDLICFVNVSFCTTDKGVATLCESCWFAAGPCVFQTTCWEHPMENHFRTMALQHLAEKERRKAIERNLGKVLALNRPQQTNVGCLYFGAPVFRKYRQLAGARLHVEQTRGESRMHSDAGARALLVGTFPRICSNMFSRTSVRGILSCKIYGHTSKNVCKRTTVVSFGYRPSG